MTDHARRSPDVDALLRLLNACPVGMVSFRDDGTVEHVNPQATALLGGSARPSGPPPPSGPTPPSTIENVVDSLAPWWPELAKIVATETGSGTVVADQRILLGDGPDARWVSCDVVRVADQQWVLALTDASSRIADEVAIRHRERRLRTVFDSIDEGFCLCEMIVDDAGSPIDYRFLEVNPLFSEMTGLADPVGHTALELVPDLEAVWIETYGRVALGGQTVRLEQGSEAMGRWFDVFAVPVEPHGHFAVVFKEETQRRQHEAAIRDAAAQATFRLRLTDALRTLDDPVEIETEAARALGEHLAAARVHYAEIEPTGTYGLVRSEYRTDGLSSVVGRHRLDDYGSKVMDEFRAGSTVCIDDVMTDRRFDDAHRTAIFELGIGSFIMVPVTRDGQVRAALIAHAVEVRHWTPAEQTLVEETAQRTTDAVGRARAGEALRVRHRRAEVVARLITALEQAANAETQANHVVEAMVEILSDYATLEAPGDGSPVLALAHRDPDAVELLRTLRQHRVDPEAAHSVARAAGGENQLLSPITPGLTREWAQSEHVAELLDRLGPRSHMAVPVSLGRGRSGALMVGITDPERDVYTPDDLSFLRETADRIGVVLAATALRRQEHHVAIRLQRALLPDDVVWHPNVVIEARYAAATADLEVGGDWYDTFQWDDGRIGLVVGDVVGHNLESAATMGRLRSAAAALAPQSAGSPAAMLDTLDDFARGRHGTDFATAACLVIDPVTGQLTYSSAGHPPAIVMSPEGRCLQLDQALSPPLCAREGSTARPEASVLLEPGSFVVMYTDGLVERRRQPVHVGISEFEAAVGEIGHGRIDAVADRLLERMQRIAFEDDVVIACFRYTPVTARYRCRLRAEGEQLSALRRELRTWLCGRGIDDPTINDTLLAVSEAATNALEHAYRHRDTGDIVIDVNDHDHHLTIHVRDHGRWRFTPAAEPIGGRGLNIIEAVAHRYERRSTPDGTVVTMIIPTPLRHPATDPGNAMRVLGRR